MKIERIITKLSELEKDFSGYDLTVGKCILSNYGMAFVTEYGDILDWELSQDDIKNILENGEI